MLAIVAATAAWRRAPLTVKAPSRQVSLSSITMASWRAEDLKRRSARVPAEVEALLAQDFPSKDQVGICWSALRDCYASEAEAITAARRYPSLVLPYMNTPSNIVGCYGTLVSLLGVQGAREVCVKKPGRARQQPEQPIRLYCPGRSKHRGAAGVCGHQAAIWLAGVDARHRRARRRGHRRGPARARSIFGVHQRRSAARNGFTRRAFGHPGDAARVLVALGGAGRSDIRRGVCRRD